MPSTSAASATTSPFLSALMAHPRFHAGRLTTDFIAEEFPDGFHGVDLPDEAKGDVVAVAAVVHQTYARRARCRHAALQDRGAGRQRQVGGEERQGAARRSRWSRPRWAMR